LKEDVDLWALVPTERLSPPQFLEADEALGGRFEWKEDVDRGPLAQVDGLWPDQLRSADEAVGGRFEPKFIAGARVAAAFDLTTGLPMLRRAAPFILRE
jgi:hypothetical protein